MKHRSDVQRDAVMQSASVGKHLDRAIGTGCLVDSDEAVIKWDIMGDEILLFECSAPCGDDLASFAPPTGPRRKVHLVPEPQQRTSVDQFTDVIQRALHEHDLVVNRDAGSGQ